MATQEIIRGLPPYYQSYLDNLTPEGRKVTLKTLASAERSEKRKHNKYRAYVLKTDGEDVGPYQSIYDGLWREQVKHEIEQSGDYVMLGLDVNTSLAKKDVRNAYRRASRRLHPDVGGSDEAFKALHDAYRRVLAITPTSL